ncbi:MAG: hypothetical protein KC582_02460 [Candidatus Magasanikbacteria bacterium]|nr:hypothetical protein [Candidatus Magasanikbacteria bacterium]MCA9391092.1 hypothetical protein [Candidatus Magasanikbacteria bacterium]USN52407.1 MAG: hypothetical protein H6759_05360 [Candidatus Nomurabacteria bacterium]HPF95019.1 hypothetical protein [bacterium]
MTQSLKKHFLELLLTELTKMVSLKEAKIASLAGSGIEARLWREKGVPAQNAWLIDSNPAVIRTMLKKQNQHPYHLYRGMAYTFPAVLYAHEGEAASLDLFHLDLYGGVEKSLRDVASLVPLVARSRAKLFALTVSDQRSHHATLNAGGLWRFINEVYGKRSLEILQSITQSHFESVAAQHAMIDPFSSVRREGATLLAWFCSQLGVEQGFEKETKDIYSLLAKYIRKARQDKRLLYPVTSIERVSYADGQRMKSYIIRLDSTPVLLDQALEQFTQAWVQSPLTFLDRDGIAVRSNRTLQKTAQSSPVLQDIVEIQGELDRLDELSKMLAPGLQKDLRKILSLIRQK